MAYFFGHWGPGQLAAFRDESIAQDSNAAIQRPPLDLELPSGQARYSVELGRLAPLARQMTLTAEF